MSRALARGVRSSRASGQRGSRGGSKESGYPNASRRSGAATVGGGYRRGVPPQRSASSTRPPYLRGPAGDQLPCSLYHASATEAERASCQRPAVALARRRRGAPAGPGCREGQVDIVRSARLAPECSGADEQLLAALASSPCSCSSASPSGGPALVAGWRTRGVYETSVAPDNGLAEHTARHPNTAARVTGACPPGLSRGLPPRCSRPPPASKPRTKRRRPVDDKTRGKTRAYRREAHHASLIASRIHTTRGSAAVTTPRVPGQNVVVTLATTQIARARPPNAGQTWKPSAAQPAGRRAKVAAMGSRVTSFATFARQAPTRCGLSHTHLTIRADRCREPAGVPAARPMDFEHQPANHVAFRHGQDDSLPAARSDESKPARARARKTRFNPASRKRSTPSATGKPHPGVPRGGCASKGHLRGGGPPAPDQDPTTVRIAVLEAVRALAAEQRVRA